ncbi:MAG: alkaline shock response membrane anchor protein AmaP [Eubacteriales bacterium]
MKVGFLSRVIFVLAALLALVASLVFLVFVWQLNSLFSHDGIINTVTNTVDNLYYSSDTAFAVATGIIVLYLIVCVWLLVLAFRKNKGEKAKAIEYIKIGTPENGQIKIAASTINSMICKNVNEIAGVADSKAKTNVVDDKTFITVGVSVDDGVIIPKVCEEIQTSTKEKIQQLTGMTIADINILVNNKL